jgi:hypothetical protein
MRASLFVTLVFLSGRASATAQSGPSPPMQMACRSNAGKFRAAPIGKPPQVNACLRDKAKFLDS